MQGVRQMVYELGFRCLELKVRCVEFSKGLWFRGDDLKFRVQGQWFGTEVQSQKVQVTWHKVNELS